MVNQIAIIALQIEDYWPVLESYLAEEGVPFQKDIVASVNSLSDVQTFLAHLKSLTSEVSFESLQQKLFQGKSTPEIKYEKFKALFNQLYDEEDLKRDDRIKSLFYKRIDFLKEMSRDEFISILLKIWGDVPENKNSATLFELLFKDILGQSLEMPLRFSAWLQFFKARVSHKEIKMSFADERGIQVLSLMSAQMTTADHRIYVGLFDEAFKTQKRSLLPLKDIEALKNQFDLAIAYPDESHLDFNLRWQTETACKSLICTVPHLSFSAEPLTPCLYFLEHNPKSDIVNPNITRSDELQKNFAVAIGESVVGYENKISKTRLKQDVLGADLRVHHAIFNQLAASEVEIYAQCSFKLLASKGYRLRDMPEVSIDLDPRQKGTLVHSLFEHLVHLVKDSSFDLAKVRLFLENKRFEHQLFINEDHFWSVQLNKLLSLSEKFYEFERFRLQNFKVSTEVAFEIYYDLDSKTFVNEKLDNAIAIRGRIDRVDQILGTNNYIIYDYKSSGGQASGYGKWMTQYQFQMLLYIFAVEVSLFQEADVQGALYYLYKDFDLSKGLVDKKTAVEKLGFSGRAKASLIDEENKGELKEQFIEFLSESFSRLKNGEFRAVPFSTDICAVCDWRKLCRAKHLM